jgi:hypothetical protein
MRQCITRNNSPNTLGESSDIAATPSLGGSDTIL